MLPLHLRARQRAFRGRYSIIASARMKMKNNNRRHNATTIEEWEDIMNTFCSGRACKACTCDDSKWEDYFSKWDQYCLHCFKVRGCDMDASHVCDKIVYCTHLDCLANEAVNHQYHGVRVALQHNAACHACATLLGWKRGRTRKYNTLEVRCPKHVGDLKEEDAKLIKF